MHRFTPFIAGLGFAALVSGCAPPEPPKPAKNVLLITVDALRADSVGWAEGARFDTTPNLTALAADSVVFDQAVTSFPGTTASMPSLMTGLFPSFEGITEWNQMTHHGFNDFEPTPRPGLSDNVWTLAEMLRDRGFDTVGFNTNPNLNEHWNFDQGFTEYDSFTGHLAALRQARQHPLEGTYPIASVVVDRVVSRLEADRRLPLFLWVHFMEPHSPYLPPAEFVSANGRPLSHRSDMEINEALYHELLIQFGSDKADLAPSFTDLGLSKEEFLEHALALYEGEILYCDHELKRILDTLASRSELDDTLIVVTADHGEEFMDHGHVAHHLLSGLAEELIRIPLLIRPPGGVAGGRTVDDLVRMVDIAPTVLDYVGLGPDATHMDGRSLRPLIEGRPDAPRTAFFSTVEYEVVRTERWKYRLEKQHLEHGRPVVRLFDIVADPLEERDLSTRFPEVVQQLAGRYEEFRAALSARRDGAVQPEDTEPEALDEATEERLRALGYLE